MHAGTVDSSAGWTRTASGPSGPPWPYCSHGPSHTSYVLAAEKFPPVPNAPSFPTSVFFTCFPHPPPPGFLFPPLSLLLSPASRVFLLIKGHTRITTSAKRTLILRHRASQTVCLCTQSILYKPSSEHTLNYKYFSQAFPPKQIMRLVELYSVYLGILKPQIKVSDTQWVFKLSTLLCFKWITNKGLLSSTGNSAQRYVAAWMGGEFGEEGILVYVWLSPSTVHLKPSQHC